MGFRDGADLTGFHQEEGRDRCSDRVEGDEAMAEVNPGSRQSGEPTSHERHRPPDRRLAPAHGAAHPTDENKRPARAAYGI